MRLGTRFHFIRFHHWVLDPKSRYWEAIATILGPPAFAGVLALPFAIFVKSWVPEPPSSLKNILGPAGLILALGSLVPLVRSFFTKTGGPIVYFYLTLRMRRKSTDILLLQDLWEAFDTIEWEYGLADPESRRFVGRRLVSAAKVLELHVPRFYAVGEVRADNLLKARCQLAASQVREFATWVALPNSETRRDLLKQLSRLMLVVIIGQFDMLPTSVEVESRKRWKRVVLNSLASLRQLFVAVAPFVFVVWLLPLVVDVPKSIDPWLRVATAGWLLISLIIPLDPFFASKIAALKDLSASLRGSGGTDPKRQP
ncbi:hypothetical protein [Micromonospora chersina]|uniref:hypothetical protein n=1 Tax=Micromonospora chersina TaxID=47854 RepID=UPI00370F9CDA